MATLVTGGAGFIGAHLVRALLDRGEDVVVFDLVTTRSTISDIRDRVKLITGDLAKWPDVLRVVRENGVRRIFHLGGMVTTPAEANPQAAYLVNAEGTFHVLEAARMFGVEQVVFSSTIGTFSRDLKGAISDDSLQHPVTMYGTSKVIGELLGRYYCLRFGLDFRALRFPVIVGPGVRTPGVALCYACIIEEPAHGRRAETRAGEESKVPVLYFKDAVRSLLMLGDADRQAINTIVYTLDGMRPLLSASEWAALARKHMPGAEIVFSPDPVIVEFLRFYECPIDDSNARKEWGWSPAYDTEALVADFLEELRLHREMYE